MKNTIHRCLSMRVVSCVRDSFAILTFSRGLHAAVERRRRIQTINSSTRCAKSHWCRYVMGERNAGKDRVRDRSRRPRQRALDTVDRDRALAPALSSPYRIRSTIGSWILLRSFTSHTLEHFHPLRSMHTRPHIPSRSIYGHGARGRRSQVRSHRWPHPGHEPRAAALSLSPAPPATARTYAAALGASDALR